MISLLNQQPADVLDLELGETAVGTIQTVSKNSRLKAFPLDLASGRRHITALSNALAKFGTTTCAAVDMAGKACDADTADLFTEVSRGVDKLLWIVEAHLQRKTEISSQRQALSKEIGHCGQYHPKEVFPNLPRGK